MCTEIISNTSGSVLIVPKSTEKVLKNVLVSATVLPNRAVTLGLISFRYQRMIYKYESKFSEAVVGFYSVRLCDSDSRQTLQLYDISHSQAQQSVVCLA